MAEFVFVDSTPRNFFHTFDSEEEAAWKNHHYAEWAGSRNLDSEAYWSAIPTEIELCYATLRLHPDDLECEIELAWESRRHPLLTSLHTH